MGPFISRNEGIGDTSAPEVRIVSGHYPATVEDEDRVGPGTPPCETMVEDRIVSCTPLPDLDRGALPFWFSGNTHADLCIPGGSVLSLGLSGDSPAKRDGGRSPVGDGGECEGL